MSSEADQSLSSRAANNDARSDDRLVFMDQGFFAGQRAAGLEEVMQVVWVYEHAIDLDGLRRVQRNLSHGLLGRLIERSPVPFGRHRWVSGRETSDIDIAECARPRAELSDWADERSQLPVDPERGPGWHFGVLPLTDGSTAVTFVASHYVLDGIGCFLAIVEAILGNTLELGYPPPRSRTRLRAVVQDVGQTARDVPEVVRALVALAKQARHRRREMSRSPAPQPTAAAGDGGDGPFVVPGVTISIELDHWDARANALGGVSNTLAAALTAKLGERMGRRNDADGAVTLQVVMSDRALGDTRAIAVSFARIRVDPTGVTTDLRDARAAIKQALKMLREAPDESSQLAPLTPFTPKRIWKQGVDSACADPARPVIYSNLGDVGWDVSRLDGTHCDYAFARGTRQNVSRQWLERTGGHMQLLSFRLPPLGKIFIHVIAYEPGAENTKPALRELAARTLAEFDLTGQID